MKEARHQRSKNKKFYGGGEQDEDRDSCIECGRPIDVREVIHNHGLCDRCVAKTNSDTIP